MSNHIVTPNTPLCLSDLPTSPPEHADLNEKILKKALKQEVKAIDTLQRRFYGENTRALLLVFQAMDAAGKDSTIRAILRGINPAGCQVFSFKQPSDEELDHGFLWRCVKRMPERGRIGVFNRSYYEEVLVVRVHPEYLDNQRIDIPENLEELWQERYDVINNLEQYLKHNGTTVLKFWLNVSHEEQKKRFLSRIHDEEKNWKFSKSDLSERALWTQYMHAYEEMLKHTSTEVAPWHAIPADNKPYMRLQVAKIVRQTLEQLDPQFPQVTNHAKAQLELAEKALLDEG